MIADYGKLCMLALVVLVVGGLGALEVLDAGAAERVLMVVLGYLTGNGVLARTRKAPSPVLAPRAEPEV